MRARKCAGAREPSQRYFYICIKYVSISKSISILSIEEQRKRPDKQAHTGEDEADTAYGAADGAGDNPRYKNRVVAHSFISPSLFIFFRSAWRHKQKGSGGGGSRNRCLEVKL